MKTNNTDPERHQGCQGRTEDQNLKLKLQLLKAGMFILRYFTAGVALVYVFYAFAKGFGHTENIAHIHVMCTIGLIPVFLLIIVSLMMDMPVTHQLLLIYIFVCNTMLRLWPVKAVCLTLGILGALLCLHGFAYFIIRRDQCVVCYRIALFSIIESMYRKTDDKKGDISRILEAPKNGEPQEDTQSKKIENELTKVLKRLILADKFWTTAVRKEEVLQRMTDCRAIAEKIHKQIDRICEDIENGHLSHRRHLKARKKRHTELNELNKSR